ncbi:outer membrane receptor protein involved in Fe transport [Janthinobacterium sp. CG_23.3]|uniref:TonB-dependent receptor plug domain-containing protein n=1 Tax=Janthinobacterium sp. CG_23.3 TaxID=3349634 RepID=UPI0038D4151D
MPQVLVTAGKFDQRRHGGTGQIVVGHEEIVRQGDRSLADVLKRLPGVSIGGAPGQGGEIRMRGLGSGYTQILLNGVAVPNGFSLDSIAPELIERIDILRAPTAEFGAQAIAGTINVVLKKALAGGQREVKLGLAEQHGKTSPQLAAQWSDRAGALSYTVAATATDTRKATPTRQVRRGRDAGGALQLSRRGDWVERGDERVFSLAPRLNWALANGDTLSLQNLYNLKLVDNRRRTGERTDVGAPTEFPDNLGTFVARGVQWRSDLGWVRQLAEGARFELKLGASDFRRYSDFHFYGLDGDARRTGEHHVVSPANERGATVAGTWRRPIGERHALALGWDGGHKRRRESRLETLFGAGGTALGGSDEHYDVAIRRLAVFAQDEWEIGAHWSLYLGLRWEGLKTLSEGRGLDAVDVRSSVWSPLLQSRYKLGGKDQLRLALSRSYKAPAILDLLPRRFTVDNDNNPSNPDTQGNPALRPELAWGLDAGYEHYFAGQGMLSANLFMRRIQDVRQELLFQRDGVWIATPANGGAASVRGVELEAKLGLQSLWPGAPALDLRANLTRNWSRVERVPGPDNRLDEQTPLSANLGVDYRWPGAALTVGGNFNLQGAGPVRQSSKLSSRDSAKRELDVYALWTLDGKTRLRLSAANLLRRDYVEQSHYQDDYGALRTTRTTSTYPSVRLTLERQL